MSRCSHICNKWTSTNPPTSTIYGPAQLPKFTIFNLPESTQPEDASAQVSAILTTHFLERFLKNTKGFQLFFIISPWMKVQPFIFTTLNSFTRLYFVRSLAEIGSIVLEKNHWILHLERDGAHASNEYIGFTHNNLKKTL